MSSLRTFAAMVAAVMGLILTLLCVGATSALAAAPGGLSVGGAVHVGAGVAVNRGGVSVGADGKTGAAASAGSPMRGGRARP